MPASADWRDDLERWLEPFVARLHHPARQHMCPVYVAGLIGPGERKSIQPIAERQHTPYDQLHHFVAASHWDAAPLEAELAVQADRLVGGTGAYLVIDDTALPKKGTHSVGVAPQYAGALGKNANCQSLVSLTLSHGEVPVPVALRLYLPESWTAAPERLGKAGVPEDCRGFRSKVEIALAELDRLAAAGVRFGCVLADADYGRTVAFRRGLGERQRCFAAGIARTQLIYPADVTLTWPLSRGSRPRRHPLPDQVPVTAEAWLAPQRWRSVSWRRGTKGRLRARFAASRVQVAEGPRVKMAGGEYPLPGDELWLIGEHRASGERKYYLANLPTDTPLKTLAATIKARWICEQAHQQLKEELGLDHFEGRSWDGLHRHALMTLLAFAFLQHQRLAKTKRGKNQSRPATRAESAGGAKGHPRPTARPKAAARALPALPPLDQPAR